MSTIDYVKNLLTLSTNKGYKTKIYLEKKEKETTQNVTIQVTIKGETIYSETANGTHFSTTSQNLAKNIIAKIQNDALADSQATTPQITTYELSTKEKPFVDISKTNTKIIDEFFVADVDPILIDHKCPHCGNMLYEEMFDIPVFTDQTNFKRYYKRKFHVCHECNKHFLPLKDWNGLIYDAYQDTKKIPERICGVKNMRKKAKHEDDDRLFIPILDYPLYIKKEPKYAHTQNGDFWSKLQKQSELNQMGYNTKLADNERRAILDEYVHEHNVYNAMGMLQFLISINNNCPNAQKIWQKDLNYLQKCDPRLQTPRY